MTSDCLIERFSVAKSAEVERCAPSILVEICCKVVVTTSQCQCQLRLTEVIDRTVSSM